MRERNLSDPLVEALAVRPDRQSTGIARAIMVEAERIAIERGHTAIGLAVGIENERARALYAALGYREHGGDQFHMTWMSTGADGEERVRGETCTYMVKALRVDTGAIA